MSNSRLERRDPLVYFIRFAASIQAADVSSMRRSARSYNECGVGEPDFRPWNQLDGWPRHVEGLRAAGASTGVTAAACCIREPRGRHDHRRTQRAVPVTREQISAVLEFAARSLEDPYLGADAGAVRQRSATRRIRRRGRAIVLEPIPESWEWLDALAGDVDADFVSAVREQPEATERPELGKAFR